MFTPGPWHVGIKQAEQIIYNYKGWAIANATVYHGKNDIQETKDNARLIAACPLMADYVIMKAKEGDNNAKEIAETAGLDIA